MSLHKKKIQISFFNLQKKIGQSGGARQWRVCYQWGIPRLVLRKFKLFCVSTPKNQCIMHSKLFSFHFNYFNLYLYIFILGCLKYFLRFIYTLNGSTVREAFWAIWFDGKLLVVTHNLSQSLGKKFGLSSERLNEQEKGKEYIINK